MTTDPPGHSKSTDVFATTHWTAVLAAGNKENPQSERALEELCQAYWYPLYAYIRRCGHAKEDAEDLTQSFFARFLEKNYFQGLRAERGRFRAFLLASLKHFLANEWDKSQRWKRGGRAPHLSLDWQTADTQFQIASLTIPSPDVAFDREWAIALLAKVIERLRAELTLEGKGNQFEHLKIFLTAAKGSIPQARIANELEMDERAVRVAIHRLRKRYGQLLRDEISQTLAEAASLEEEMRALFGAFTP